MNNVCNSVIAIVNTTALVAPMNSDKNDPTQVGHAMNNPVAAPMLPSPPVFFVIEIAFTANAVFVATRYETIICNRRFIGTTLIPTCSVKYATNFGIYPGGPQHGVTCADGHLHHNDMKISLQVDIPKFLMSLKKIFHKL